MKRILSYAGAWLYRYGHWLLPAGAAILSFASTHVLMGPVLNRSGDNIYHLMNGYAMMHGIQAGDNVLGPLAMEMGQPVLRFYQSLFYLFNNAVHFITGADMRTIHNTTLCIAFGLSPFTLFYFMRKLGLNRWTAGLASYASFVSVAAFGNSFEAFFQAGIVTQSMGGLFFPWFMGVFVGMLRGENSPVSAAVLFALAFLSHAIMAVYAVFIGALYFFMSESSIIKNVKRIAVFGMLGAALVAFWVFPFIEHNRSMRPVPDPIFRGSSVHWYTSVSSAELLDVGFNGYLLDDARHTGNERNPAEQLMDRINIMGTIHTRPPIFSIATAWGILVSLFSLRRLAVRFLLGAFAFSLMLFTGPDDFTWTMILPFMDTIQGFRCTYLIDLFAVGLSAIGIEALLKPLFAVPADRKRWWRPVLPYAAGAAATAVILVWIGSEIIALGQTHVTIREPDVLNRDLAALEFVPDKGYPFRVEVRTEGRPKIRQAWFGMHGFVPYCTHWKGTGPDITFKLCGALGDPRTGGALYALTGVRWFTGWGPKIKAIHDSKDEDGLPIMYDLPVGKDPLTGADNSSRITMDSGFHYFLRPMISQVVPVVCNDRQWLWLADSWTRQYRNKLWSRNAPIVLRVPAGTLASSGLLADAAAVFYFDHSAVAEDKAALARFAQRKPIISPLPIDGVPVRQLALSEPPWMALPKEANSAVANLTVHEREEMDPGLTVAHIEPIRPKRHTAQHFAFDVEALEPVTLVLPMENYPGWTASLNGRPHPVFSAGPDLIGVRVPKGVWRITFDWVMPWHHRLFLWLTFAAIAAVLWIWGARVRRCIRNPRHVPTW